MEEPGWRTPQVDPAERPERGPYIAARWSLGKVSAHRCYPSGHAFHYEGAALRISRDESWDAGRWQGYVDGNAARFDQAAEQAFTE